jgi:uncharacterized protein (TIGR00725 family)
MDRRIHIGVIGAGLCSKREYELAYDVGSEIAKMHWILFCGGLGGVMEGVAKGCSESGGLTVGLLPGLEKDAANPYIQIPIPTGLDEGRNILIIRASDVLIAIAGGYGTLSEIGFALKTEKPVVGMGTWKDIEGIHYVSDHREAIQKVSQLSRKGKD